MSKVISVVGGCTTKNKPVGFQFKTAGDKCYLGGSFTCNDFGKGGESEQEIKCEFRYGQGYSGCRVCNNKYIYQCHACGSFNCYDGKETYGVTCPTCGECENVPASSDKRDDSQIVRSYKITEVILAVDVSTSMNESVGYMRTRLDEVKTAAVNNFVRALNGVKMSIVTFGESVETVLDFTTDAAVIESKINGLVARGGTPSPLAHIRRSFPDYAEDLKGAARYIVIFTDGAWAGSGHETTAAKLKADGVSIITIGCAGADHAFLTNIATQGASIKAEGDSFGGVFASAANLVTQS